MAVAYLQRLVKHFSLLLACFFCLIGQASAREGYGNEDAQEYGDAVYRYLNLADWGYKNYNHAGILAGMNSSDSKRVIEAALSDCNPDNSFQNSFSIYGDEYYGAYTLSNTTLTFSSRKAIVKTARDLVADGDIGYPTIPMIGHDALEYFGDYFSGYVNDIDTIRCDGVVEYCYEKNGKKVWWDTSHSSYWNIATDGGVEYHNNMPGSSVDPDFELSPWAQRGAPQVTGPSFNDPNPNNTKMTRSAVIDLPTYQASSWQSGSHMVVRINATDSKSGIHKISWRLPGESSGWHYVRKSQHPDYDSSSVDINVYSEGTLYYWAQDNGGNQPQYAESLHVNFNEPPDTPYNESPNDGATGVSRTANLDWSCTDPDGDTPYYTVWLSKGNNIFSSSERIKIDATGSNADPGTMDYGAHYYWKVQADDHNSGVTTVDHWDFYTESSTRIIRLSGDLAFGNVTVGQTSQRTLTIYNDGNSTLTVSGISYPTGFSPNWSGTISARGSRNVTVTFAPTAATSYGGTVTVNSDKTSGTNTRSCSGTGTTAPTRIIRLSGDLAFGSVTVGQTSQRTLTIYNDGNSTLTVSGISYPTGFSPSWSGTIGAGGSRNVTVTFAPTAATSYGGTVTVNSDKTSGTNTRSCSGTGTTAPTRIIRLSGDLAFGSVTVGQTSQRTLTIYNDGNSTLTVSGISYPTGFSGSWSGTISADGSRNVPVTFAPTAATSYGGTVTVNSDKTSGTNTRSCSGTGTNDDKPTVTVTATDSTASEPGTNTGKYRISRTGSTASSLSVYFTMSGSATNGTDYNTISSPKTISAGSSYVDITLTPKDDSIYEGDETSVLTISTNSAYDRGSPYSATVTIQDIDCTYSIDPTSEHFSSSGGTGSVNVTTESGCDWSATSNDGWITITSGSSGSGNGTVNYSVSSNSSISSRTGTMTIAGLTFTVTQDVDDIDNCYVNKDDFTCSGNSPCYSNIQDAIDAAGPVSTIKVVQGFYDEDITLNTSKTLALQGGWDSTFTTQSSNTTINSLTISSGTIVPSNLILQPAGATIGLSIRFYEDFLDRRPEPGTIENVILDFIAKNIDTIDDGSYKDFISDPGYIESVHNLITHFYENILGREPESWAVEAWEHGYFNHSFFLNTDVHYVAREMGLLFFLSEEYDLRNRSNAEFIDDCSHAFLNQSVSKMEQEDWICSAMEREEVVATFANSDGFTKYIDSLFH